MFNVISKEAKCKMYIQYYSIYMNLEQAALACEDRNQSCSCLEWGWGKVGNRD